MKNYLIFAISLWLYLSPATSQQFIFHSVSPFGIQTSLPDSSDIAGKYMFADFDRDGDLDLVLVGIDSIDWEQGLYYKAITYFVDYQENTGDKNHPSFATRKSLVNDFPFRKGLFMPTLGDLDNDGLIDMVIAAEIDDIGTQHFLFYHQLANGTFDVQRMENYGIDALMFKSTLQPELTDLDRDGDLDLLLTGYAPAFGDTTGTSAIPLFQYAKNIGTPDNPTFISWFQNPFSLVPDTVPAQSVSGDINLDGDVDILAISSAGNTTPFYFYENIPGTNGKPSFKLPLVSPFGLPLPEEGVNYISPTLVDLDGDGDLDLFVYRSDTSDNDVLQYYENTLIISDVKPVVDYASQITVIPNPAREVLTIVNTSSYRVVEVNVYSNSGNLVRQVRNNPEKPVAINNLPNGLYILRIRMENGREILKKVIIMNE